MTAPTPAQRRRWRENNRERIAVYARKYRESRAQVWRADSEHPAHGKYATYGNGCRCDKCREGWRVYITEYRKTKREASTDD